MSADAAARPVLRTDMVRIATFSLGAAGMLTIVELSLMPVTWQWLIIDARFRVAVVTHQTVPS